MPAAFSKTLPLCDWREPAPSADDSAIASLAEGTGLPRTIARLLVDRRLASAGDPDSAAGFLRAPLSRMVPPGDFPGVADAARKILSAIDREGEIVVYGDFDVDGIVATAILTEVLRRLGGRVRPFIPFRAEGYGLSEAAVSRCLAEGAPALLVTADCGMGAGASLQRFLDAGAEVVVSDHHNPGAPLPPACTVVSTHGEGVPEACRSLCGAGVAYKIACEATILRHPAPDRTGRRELQGWLDALAVATVADVVPLVGENRIYVRQGLALLNRHPRLGLAALIRETFANPVEIGTYHIGFILGPHINSSGRMESAAPALDLLLTDDPDQAKQDAVKLKQLNALRRQKEAELLAAIDGQLNDPAVFNPDVDGAIVAAGEGWHAGTAGIAAARVSNQYNRPAIVLSIEGDEAHGSVRAPEGYNAFDALQATSSHLSRFGGHASAAGLALAASEIPTFRKAFAAECARQAGGPSIRPSLEVAGWLEWGEIGEDFMKGLRALEPCGPGNPRPVWGLRGVKVKATPIGKDKTHLRLQLTREGLRLGAIWFGAAEHLAEIESVPRWDIVGGLSENYFQGDVEIQLEVCDARPCQEKQAGRRRENGADSEGCDHFLSTTPGAKPPAYLQHVFK